MDWTQITIALIGALGTGAVGAWTFAGRRFARYDLLLDAERAEKQAALAELARVNEERIKAAGNEARLHSQYADNYARLAQLSTELANEAILTVESITGESDECTK